MAAAPSNAAKDGLERYYAADCRLKAVHQTLWASLCPMVRDRLYDALILVLQQRGVVQEEAANLDANGCSEREAARKRRIHQMVCDEPLYRLLGKLQSGFGAERALVFAKSFNKSCDRLSYIHKSRLILPQDKGISNLFASKIQELLLLVHDSYHIDRRHDVRTEHDPISYDIEPAAFHLILRNHTYCQLLRRHDRARRQIKALLNAPKTRPLSSSPSIEHTDFLGVIGPESAASSKQSVGPKMKRKSVEIQSVGRHLDGNRKRRASAPVDERHSVPVSDPVPDAVSHSNSNWNSPSGRFWKVGLDSVSLSPLKRRRHSVDHPVYVPRLREVLDDEFWLSQYRWYIYYFQPRRMKYVYFILLIQQFYGFRRPKVEAMPLPAAFSVHFGQRGAAQKSKEPEADWMVLLSFDLQDMDPQSQRALGVVEYAQFIYYHFVHHAAKFKIQFSDQSIVHYIEHCLFDCKEPLSFHQHLALNIFDKMWNAVFRYLHQMTYEPFVVWMNTK